MNAWPRNSAIAGAIVIMGVQLPAARAATPSPAAHVVVATMPSTVSANTTASRVAAPPPCSQSRVKTYTVTGGDSLTVIAEKEGLPDWFTLWKANPGVADPNLVYAGQQLVIPVSAAVTCPRAVPAATGPVVKPVAEVMRISATPATPAGSNPAMPLAARAPSPHITATSVARAHPHKTPRVVNLQINTVPAMPSARFVLDGQTLSTNPEGVAVVQLDGSLAFHQLQLVNPEIDTGTRQAKFTRWWGQPNHNLDFQPNLAGFQIRRNLKIEAAFRVSELVHYQFVDQAGKPVDPARVTSAALRSDTGQLVDLRRGGELRLLSERPDLTQNTLISRPSLYSLDNVMIDGSNVVNAGEQKLRPSQRDTIKFVLLLRDVKLQAHDFLFGTPAGSTVTLTYPNGRTEKITFGQDKTVTLHSLARGHYKVKVNASGYSFGQAVTLSRNQVVDLPVVSYLDLGVFVLVLTIGTTTLLAVGRIRKRRAVRPAHDDQPVIHTTELEKQL